MFWLLLWPFSGECRTKDMLQKIQEPTHKYKTLSFKMFVIKYVKIKCVDNFLC
jgi:hypothetical protein